MSHKSLLSEALQFIRFTACDFVGVPARLWKTVAENPELRVALSIPPQSAALHNVVRWDLWRGAGDRDCGTLHFQKKEQDRYRSFDKFYKPLADFIREENVGLWECDIRDISCLSASKADLSIYPTLDEFAYRECVREYTLHEEETPQEALQRNLRHEEVGAPIYIGSKYSFTWYQWDGRLGLSNTGGSHHFAAARMLAKQLGTEVLIQRELTTYKINFSAAEQLLSDFSMFAVSGSYPLQIAFQAYDVPYCIYSPPPIWGGSNSKYTEIFLFPNDNSKSFWAADMLRQFRFFDFNLFLRETLKECRKHSCPPWSPPRKVSAIRTMTRPGISHALP